MKYRATAIFECKSEMTGKMYTRTLTEENKGHYEAMEELVYRMPAAGLTPKELKSATLEELNPDGNPTICPIVTMNSERVKKFIIDTYCEMYY